MACPFVLSGGSEQFIRKNQDNIRTFRVAVLLLDQFHPPVLCLSVFRVI